MSVDDKYLQFYVPFAFHADCAKALAENASAILADACFELRVAEIESELRKLKRKNQAMASLANNILEATGLSFGKWAGNSAVPCTSDEGAALAVRTPVEQGMRKGVFRLFVLIEDVSKQLYDGYEKPIINSNSNSTTKGLVGQKNGLTFPLKCQSGFAY